MYQVKEFLSNFINTQFLRGVKQVNPRNLPSLGFIGTQFLRGVKRICLGNLGLRCFIGTPFLRGVKHSSVNITT